MTEERRGPASTVPVGSMVTKVAGALIGVVIVQLLFALSYLGAFHDPAAHDLKIAVAAPTTETAGDVARQLKQQAGSASIP